LCVSLDKHAEFCIIKESVMYTVKGQKLLHVLAIPLTAFNLKKKQKYYDIRKLTDDGDLPSSFCFITHSPKKTKSYL
jgi:hypothetical protein